MTGVKYEHREVAERYARSRALSDEVLGRWQTAIASFIPDRRPMRILDLGAGTGIFARAWSHWYGCDVVAVEPASAMRSEMIHGGLPERVFLVAGCGERLPLGAASVDVVWLSTALHHLSDLETCVREFRRVLVPGGVALIRGLFADCGEPAGLEFLPGAARARSWFPSITATEATFSGQGFELLGIREVEDAGPATVGEAAERIRRLYDADSLLGRFTAEEIADGLATMEATDPGQPLPPSVLPLVAFGVRPGSGATDQRERRLPVGRSYQGGGTDGCQ